MSVTLENFCPKLRAGKVIPQGSRIIFETDNPYNQIILPMALADLILLCSGQFSVREIVEKIYKKQGAVPFRSILKAVHILHQGGFFENGNELELNSHLRSWMEPSRQSWNISWRFGQRIVADTKSPSAFYILSLSLLAISLFGMQSLPQEAYTGIENWFQTTNWFTASWQLFLCSSLLQTIRHVIRGMQLLLLTGKAYNVSARLSLWGIHLHIGDEANDLFENRLYMAMFHISQIMVGWLIIAAAPFCLPEEWAHPLLLLTTIFTFWELNPFANSEGFKLIQSLLLPTDRESVTWHFEQNSFVNALTPDGFKRNQEFARICAVWGSLWLMAAFYSLYLSAVYFGPSALSQSMRFDEHSVLPALGLVVWMTTLYMMLQSFVERLALTLMRPWWRSLLQKWNHVVARKHHGWTGPRLLLAIQHLPLFSHFHDQGLQVILDRSQVLEFGKDSLIINQGDPSRELYILLEGEVEISRYRGPGLAERITLLGPISIFGEGALLEDTPRAAQVISRKPTVVLQVPVHCVRQVAQESQTVRQLNDFRNAIMVNQFFASSEVFRSLSAQSVEFLSNRGALEYFDSQQIVFRQGDVGDSLFLILRGSIDIEIHGTRIKRLGQGNFFGEIALIASIARTATIHTLEPCVFFRISADAFWEVLVQNIDLGIFIESVSESRLLEDLEIAPVNKAG